MELIIQLLISMVFSAYFSGMEIAFVSSNKLRFEMEKTNNVSSYILSVFYRHSNNFISTMLVGNNIALVIYGILMAQLIEHYILADVISNQALLVPIETVISTLIILVTGEFLPKTLFKINPNATLKFFSVPTFACYIILYPISRFSSKTNKEDREKAFTKVDLDYFIQSSIEEGKEGEEIDNEIKIFRNALDFSNVKIRDCMIPRTEIIAVDFDTPLTELKKVFIENGISKIIVYKGNIDNIVGYIHSSEMFRGASEWQNGIRSIPFVPETMAAHKLMRIFKQQKRSLAVVVDEFGGISGIVALEDLVEEILGEIEDEHDTTSTVAKQLAENEYIFSGRVDIEKANETFNLDLPESENYQTIGGLILNECQSIPKVNEVIKTGDFTFKIIKVSANRIELVKLFTPK